MVQRYDDWDKKRYKTTKSMPWWMKNIRVMQCIGWGAGFFWVFGDIYRMLIVPSKEQISLTLFPQFKDDVVIIRKRMEQREKALVERVLSDDKSFDRSHFPSDTFF